MKSRQILPETTFAGMGLTPRRIISTLTLSAVPLGAALAFVIQPMAGKAMLPEMGGTAVTWIGATLFFQIALLLGYVWGIVLARLTLRGQFLGQLALAVLALGTFRLPGGGGGGEPGLGLVFWTLGISNLPAMTLLFSLSPWVHSWRERLSMPEPYALYAISSLGSLAALVLYPVVVETNLTLSAQEAIWRSLFILVALLAVCGVLAIWKLSPPAETYRAEKLKGFDPLKIAGWIALSALPCMVMLGAVGLVASEVGSNPLAWAGPLGVYLAAFAIVFSGRWRPWLSGVAVAGLGLALAAYMVHKGFGVATVDGMRFWLLILLCGLASVVSIALLHSTRPENGGAWFYLVIAAGGVLGGMLSLFAVPSLFPRPAEFPVFSGLVLACGLFWGTRWRNAGTAAACLALSLGPVFLLGMRQANEDKMGDGVITHYRDVNSHLMIKTDAISAVLSSDTTTHGSQLTETPEARRQPTHYYTESSAAGRVIAYLQAERPAMRICVIGLGAGTLATYVRAEDEIVFFDIDPKIEPVARNHFTYLKDCRGALSVQLADGRKALERAGAGDFDLIVVDAFMGDGVPHHLLTREALEVYQSRLLQRDGLLLIHATMRYSNLFPRVAATTRTLGWEAVGVETVIESSLKDRDWDAATSNYIVSGREPLLQTVIGKIPYDEDEGRVKRSITRLNAVLSGTNNIWTDERSAALDTIDINKWLFGS
jgi:predicted O-methyltransferase YrrM